jgi:hypothetical protein
MSVLSDRPPSRYMKLKALPDQKIGKGLIN